MYFNIAYLQHVCNMKQQHTYATRPVDFVIFCTPQKSNTKRRFIFQMRLG